MNFDQVAVQMPGGGFNMMTADEFMKIPMNERIKLLMGGKLQFIKDGKVISSDEAFKKK